MFTWFRRGDEFLRYEARLTSQGVFELTIMRPDGTEAVERFPDQEALAGRQLALQQELKVSTTHLSTERSGTNRRISPRM